MSEDIKLEVIKKTQDLLSKHIKKPPLTEKLLKKPPFRFLHDIVTNVIKETGFLNGLFTDEELNHENIKDRDSKVAFLDKLISAVKITTGTTLSVRATKIVAGHEPTKTNELLQAIGRALDKKIDSTEYVQQFKRKAGKKAGSVDPKKKEDTGKTKEGKVREGSQDSRGESVERKKPPNPKLLKEKEASKSSSKTKKEGTRKGKEEGGDKKEEKRKEKKQIPSPGNETLVSPRSKIVTEDASVLHKSDEKGLESVIGQRHSSITTPHMNAEKAAVSDNRETQRLPADSSPKTSAQTETKESPEATVKPLGATHSPESVPPQAVSQQAPQQVQSTAQPLTPTTTPAPVLTPVPLVRPRTAARVGSARPGAPRIRNRGEPIVATEELVKPSAVTVIVEGDSNKKDHEDDENLVVVETAMSEDTNQSSGTQAVSSGLESRPTSGQGHLVAQILETQKELEVGNAGTDGSGDANLHRVEIEWEAGRKRERESVAREMERMRNFIQTLTRAAHPLGKLMDSLQEDVDSMQHELTHWQNMQSNLEQQLRVEENLSAQATQPMKEQLKQLQNAVRTQLDLISAAKANILSNDERILRLLSS